MESQWFHAFFRFVITFAKSLNNNNYHREAIFAQILCKLFKKTQNAIDIVYLHYVYYW